MPRQVSIQGQNYTEHDLDCPECGHRMRLKSSRYGLFYSCERWRETGCKGSHGAHPDGSPLGTPADQATKQARMEAHEHFNQLYESGQMSKKEAYAWLQRAMRLTEQQAHIGNFTREQCQQLIEILTAEPLWGERER